MRELADISGLVPTLDSETTETGDPFLVMPLFRGGSLLDELKRSAVPWARAASLVRTVAIALAKAHDRQILHLDVKPANVLLDESGKPWLSDFGIAEMIGSTASMSGAMMTPAYTPPERLRDAKRSKLTDVYGLGATLFALLAGTAPFGTTTRSTNPAAVMMSVLNDPVPIDQLPRDVPFDLVHLVEHAMEKEPENRLSSVSEISEKLRDILATHGHDPGHFREPGETADPTLPGPGILRDLQSSLAKAERASESAQQSAIAPDPAGTIVGPSERERLDALVPETTRERRSFLRIAAALLGVGLVVVLALSLARQLDRDGGEVATGAGDSSTIDDAPGVATTLKPLRTTTTFVDPSIVGTTVRLLANFGQDAELEMIADRFEERLGVTIEFTTTRNQNLFLRALDDQPQHDLVIFSSRSEAERRCGEGSLVALDKELVDVLHMDYADGLVLTQDGSTCGAALAAAPEFYIWYNPTAMTNAAYDVPATWDELLALFVHR